MKSKKIILISVLLMLIVSSVGISQTTSFGKNKINYDDFNWEVYKTPHFNVYFYPEEQHLLNSLVQWLEASYIQIAKKYDWVLSKRIPVFFYKSKSEFEQTSIYPAFLPVGVEAFAEPLRNRFVVPLDQPPTAMVQMITHELTHIFQYDILYNFSYAKAALSSPPLWFIEGMAEHTARGLTAQDEMRIRDYVIYDQIPPLMRLGSNQFASYQLGQTIVDYMVETYNQAGFNAFLQYIRRNGANPGSFFRGLTETFKVSPEQFNSEWRKWMRQKYIPLLVEKKEPDDYGKPITYDPQYYMFSPKLSPSGELIAAISIIDNDIDIGLFSSKDGRLWKDLTPGFTNDYQYIMAGDVTHRFHGGADLCWSPDGNTIAFFARTGRNRSIFLIDAYTGVVKQKFYIELDQALTPAYTPDGKAILFAASKDGTSKDIYKLDLLSGNVSVVLKDEFFNSSPIPSADGKYIYYLSDINGFTKLFRTDLQTPNKREQITYGKWNDYYPVLSADGNRILYVSEETGTTNIYELDLEKNIKTQYTDVISGLFSPQYLGKEGFIMFSAYQKGRYSWYTMKPDNPLIVSENIKADEQKEQVKFRKEADDWQNWNIGSKFLPDIEVSEEKIKKNVEQDFFVDDAFINGGIASDGTLLTYSYLQFSDMTSAIKFRVTFATIGSYRNIGLLYVDQGSRLNWGFSLYDTKYYFVSNLNFSKDNNVVLSKLTLENMGVTFFGRYPFSLYTRLDFSLGYLNRDFQIPAYFSDQINNNEDLRKYRERFISGNFVPVSLSLVHDTVKYDYNGPISGAKFNVSISHSLGFSEDFLSFTDLSLDYRDYEEILRGIIFAFRLVGNHSFGESPNVFIFGGMDTMRGYDYLELSGNTTFFGNFELRFPVINRLDLPIGIILQDIRGTLFLDVGGAFFKDDDFKFFSDGEFKLQDGIAAYGFGINWNLIGLEFNWNWARKTDFANYDDWVSQFWIGYKF
jgi:hypothetical protein